MYSSINDKYYTQDHTWTGSVIPVYTTVYYRSGTPRLTAYGYIQSDILEAEGYRITSSVTTVPQCSTTTTVQVPPSPTGSMCSLHIDHCKMILFDTILSQHLADMERAL